MQINGTTLTPRQAHLVRAALHREQARVLDAMRIIDMTAVHPKARDHVNGALILTIDEISNLIDLINHDQEAAK